MTMALLLALIVINGCASQTGAKTEGTGPVNTGASSGKKEETVSASEEIVRNREVLWDFKKQTPERAEKFSAAETRAVVKYLLGDGADPAIEITSRVQGSFTGQNARETLYFISGCDDEESKRFTTDCPHVSWNSAGWLAIYDGSKPVLKIREALGGEIVKVTDVDGDGRSEILNFTGYAGMGIITLSANLGRIKGGKYEMIKSFKGYVSNCDEGETADENHGEKAAKISYLASKNGKMPTFSEEFFGTKCRQEGAAGDMPWKKITKKEFELFFESNS
jgi:hypothetical protein